MFVDFGEEFGRRSIDEVSTVASSFFCEDGFGLLERRGGEDVVLLGVDGHDRVSKVGRKSGK